MALLCTTDDVMARPQLQGVALSAAQVEQIDPYIEEASVLVEGYLGHTYPQPSIDPAVPDLDPIPDAARIVAARAVARALTATPVDPNFDQYSSGMGPFTHSKHVAQDVLGGGVWLTHQDKMALDSIPANARISNISMFRPHRRPLGMIGQMLYPAPIWPPGLPPGAYCGGYYGEGYDA